MQTFKLENYPKHVEGHAGYIIEREGTYRGLGQFSSVTWNSLRKQGLKPSYSSVGTPEHDAMATLLLLRDSTRYHRNTFGMELNDFSVAYLYHNQGAPSAANYLRTGILTSPKQSSDARQLFKEINRGPYN